MRALPRLCSERLVVKLLEPADAGLMARFRIQNRAYLEPWEPVRPPGFYTEAFWQVQLRIAIREFRSGSSLCLVILNEREDTVLGVCNYTNMVRGTFQSCHLGYALAEQEQGRGIMFEALTESNRYVFEALGLHRIMANYMPHNGRSGRLLEKLGFVIEGRASDYLMINGKWEDHVLTSRINPRHL